MKRKTTILTAVFCYLCIFSNAQSWLLPSQTSIKRVTIDLFKKIDSTTAVVYFTQNVTDSTYAKVEYSQNSAFTIPQSSGFHYLGNTITSYTDTITIPIGTMTYYTRIATRDSAQNGVDTSNVALMMRNASIISSVLTNTGDGYTDFVQMDAGNDTINWRSQLSTDPLFSTWYEYHNEDKFSFGTITYRDTVNALVYPYNGYRRIIMTQKHGGTSDTVITAFSVLPPLTLPYVALFGQPTATSTSITSTVVCDTYGYQTTAVALIRELGVPTWNVDTFNLALQVGQQFHTDMFNNRIPLTTYEINYCLTNAVGTKCLLQIVQVQTLQEPDTFNIDVSSANATDSVNIGVDFTMAAGSTYDVTVGYKAVGAPFLQEFQAFTGMTVNSFSVRLQLPTVPGWYIAVATGIDAPGGTIMTDTMMFYVSSPLAVHEVVVVQEPKLISVNTNYAQGEIDIECIDQKVQWSVRDISGRIVHKGQGNQILHTRSGVYFVKTEKQRAIKIVVH